MMTGTYNYTLVALSYIVAVLASYTALELTRHVATRDGRAASLWLAAGSVSLGVGIWTMHFVGMLAFRMRMPFTYDIGITALSLVIGIATCAFGIWVASKRTSGAMRVGASGVLIGCGIAAMHYTGMAAMRMAGSVSYDPVIVAASVVVAIVAATAAISIMISLAQGDARGAAMFWFKSVAALVMGLAICGMHYTGMAAARYEPAPGVTLLDIPATNTSLSWYVGITALFILGITHLTVFFDLRIAAEQRRNREAQRSALLLNELLDASSNEIFVVDVESLGIVNANQGACRNLGYTLDELTTKSLADIVVGATEDTFRQRIDAMLNSESKELYFESMRTRADGTLYPVQVHMQASKLGDTPYLLAIATDITAKKALQSRLDRAKKLEAIGRLATGVAHQIYTPAQYVGDNLQFLKEVSAETLNLITAFREFHAAALNDELTPARIAEASDLINAVDPDYLSAEIPTAIEQSLDGISRISNVVRAMQEFSHTGSESHELTDLNKCIRNTITVATNEWKYIAELNALLDPELPLVPCRSQDIGQVVLQLIVNAAHAIEARRKTDPDAESRIDVMTRYVGDFVEISVSDTGGGIPEEKGLAIAHHTIVDAHNGSLQLEVEDGVGSIVTIKLPSETAAATSQNGDSPDSQSAETGAEAAA